MPCQTCSIIFKIKPCNHPTGIFKDRGEVCINSNMIIYNMTEDYYNLYKYCPCKICLVNSACQTGKTCKPFMDRLLPSTSYKFKSNVSFTKSGWTVTTDVEPKS